MKEVSIRVNAQKPATKELTVRNSASGTIADPTTGMVMKNNMFGGPFMPGNQNYGTSVPLSQPDQLGMSNSYFLLSLFRIYLTYAYSTHGIAQTIIDQPIDDAFRGGFDIETDELDPEEIDEIQRDLVEGGYLDDFKEAIKWKRLFGGGGLIINDGQDLDTEFNMDALDENTPLKFIPADRWELLYQYLEPTDAPNDCPYNYYGQPVHKSRVIRMIGKQAPSFVRRQLQGWGMSVLECLLRNLNAYTKNEEVVYELIDEAKIDVWKIKDFNTNILSSIAEGQLNQRLEIATKAKNYHNAVIMDSEDEYDQKQISMSGLGDILQQIRIGMAAAARIPMAKLFGLSAAGFNSGEDDIENYNAIVESTVREDARRDLHKILRILCMRKFGFAPEIEVKFKALRVLSAEQEENVKTQRYTRATGLYKDGILNPVEYCQQLKADGVLTMDTEVGQGIKDPEPPVSAMDLGGGPGGDGRDPKDGKKGDDGK